MIIQGKDRNQIELLCLDSMVSQNSIVRIIDLFVENLPMDTMQFKKKGKALEGRPAYSNKLLLKLYIYGYFNRVRSSRRLERESITNIEAIWLLQGLRPCYKTIAEFRKVNRRAFKKSFRQLNQILRNAGLFSSRTVAVDGSKFRAQNSKKNNYNEKKINDHLSHIDKQIEKYLSTLDTVDDMEEKNESTQEQYMEINQRLEHLAIRKEKYENLKQQILEAQEKGITQLSTTDPDARALPKKMNIVEVGYNVVTSCDSENKLITNFEVTNEHDTYALAKAARKAKVSLAIKEDEYLTVLADKGFDTGHQLKECHQHNIDTLVAVKNRKSRHKKPAFAKSKFIYNEQKDTYSCPNNEEMKTTGVWYKRGKEKLRRAFKIKRYTLPFAVCKRCPYKEDCAGKSNLTKSKGRYIERSEFQEYVDKNIEQVKARKDAYRKRQAIVEHPFGTIKRGWGYDYTLLKTQKKVEGEFSLIFLCYNLRRALSILGLNGLKEAIKASFLRFLSVIANMKRNSSILFYNSVMHHNASHAF